MAPPRVSCVYSSRFASWLRIRVGRLGSFEDSNTRTVWPVADRLILDHVSDDDETHKHSQMFVCAFIEGIGGGERGERGGTNVKRLSEDIIKLKRGTDKLGLVIKSQGVLSVFVGALARTYRTYHKHEGVQQWRPYQGIYTLTHTIGVINFQLAARTGHELFGSGLWLWSKGT